jgi:lipopolysaccharide export system protein LptC
MFQHSWKTATARLAVGLVLAVAGCRQSPRSETKVLAPELNLERVRFRVWRGSELRAFGEARQVTIRRDTTESSAADLRAEFPSGKEPVTVAAPAGEGVLSASTFTLRGGVELTRGDAQALTDHASYAPVPGGGARIEGDAPVKVARPGFELEGVGFTYDLVSDVLDLGGPVVARYARAGGAR